MPRQVTLQFNLGEDVTPDIFAGKVAQACAVYSTLRPGESVQVPGSDRKYVRLPSGAMREEGE